MPKSTLTEVFLKSLQNANKPRTSDSKAFIDLGSVAIQTSTDCPDAVDAQIDAQDDELKENIMDLDRIESRIEEIFKDVKIEKDIESALKKAVKMLFNESVSLESMKNKLQILFEYEEHYLKLIKEYKEEIKFCNTMQEDLRRERSQFFTQILKEVSDTLKKAEVESSVASQWVQDLVDSYTKSIDISSDLAKTHVIDVIGKIRDRAKKEIMPVKSDGTEDNGSKEMV